MVKITTESGFKCEFDNDDWDLLEKLIEADENPAKIPGVLKYMLGEEKYQDLRTHCTVEGKVKASLMIKEYYAIVSSEEAKNFTSSQ